MCLLLSAVSIGCLYVGTGCVPGSYEAVTPDSLFSEFFLVRDLMDSKNACFVARENSAGWWC